MKYITLDRILMVGVILLLIFWPRGSSDKGGLDLSLQSVDSLINKRNQLILSQIMRETENQKELKRYTDSIFALSSKNKEVHTYYKEVIKYKFDSIYIPYDTLPTLDSNCLSIFPLSGRDSTPYYDITIKADESGFTFDSLSIKDSLYFRVLENKRLFRKNTYEVQALHTNPYIQVKDVNSIKFSEKKKPWWISIIIALGLGIIIGNQ